MRAAQAEAAEDFDPVRIRPFVQVGDDDGEPHGTAPSAEELPATAGEAERAAADVPTPVDDVEADAVTDADADVDVDAQRSDGRESGGRRRRRVGLTAGVGAAAAAVLVTGGIIGGLFFYEAPSRDGSDADDIRAGIPDAVAAQEASRSATPSPTNSTASPSSTAATSPGATPTTTATDATPDPSATLTRDPSGSDATLTAAPSPTVPDGPPPVLGLGDRGAEVTELQLRLHQVGLYNGDADGDYDRGVQSAVRGYQLTRVLLEDESGVYGEATRASLESETTEP
ncbi:peptidoglycan-binding domain-containing protein [Streptomyces sp. AC495_CC817]|uniref:peptidoglycan-binding domain-containing protein n=1 Tax=Streptomyces sp. AC495_CC817 TaxID=2823900 RepID=UPI0027E1E438|nr:peptidoglycan-binding domain-containing protein [Streptomyces sp. AC495_CC817]